MAFNFPLYHRSGSLIFLDDDIDYLEMLGMVVPSFLQVELFSRPAAFIARMNDEPARWEADAGHHLQMIDRWRHGHHLLPQVLRYWGSNPARYQLAQTCVVDFAMPGIDGLKVLETLVDWPGSRILLTGQADEQIAIKAFNNGLIDQFIPKQTADIAGRLMTTLIKLARRAHPRLNTVWRTAMQSHHQALLDRERPDGRGEIAAARRPVDHRLVDRDRAEQEIDVAARLPRARDEHDLARARRGASHAVDMLAIGVGRADHPQQHAVAHGGVPRQVLLAEEHALAGAAAHVDRGDRALAHPLIVPCSPLP